MQLLPDRIEILNLLDAETMVWINKYQYLYLGLFGFVPAALIVVARILRARGLVERNFMFMTLAAFVLALVFLFVCIYGMTYQIAHNRIDLLRRFDIYGAAVVAISLIAGLLSNFYPRLRRNDIIGLKNRYTSADNRIWVKVHYVAADVYMAVFYLFAVFSSSLSIWLDFRYGWVHLLLWLATVLGLIVWGRVYSRMLGKRYAVQTAQGSAGK